MVTHAEAKKKSLFWRAVRRIAAWLLCTASDKKGVILVPGFGVFIKNNDALEVR